MKYIQQNNNSLVFNTNGDSVVTVNFQSNLVTKTYFLPDVTKELDRSRTNQHFHQLQFLERIGIKIPDKLKTDKNHSEITMSYIEGGTFSEKLSINPDCAEELLAMSGIDLANIHSKLEREEKRIKSILIKDKNLNYHNAQNFINFTCKLAKTDVFKNPDNKFERDFTSMVSSTELVLKEHTELLSEGDIIFGDFKPENILFCETDNQLVFIDPMLSNCRKSCDLGKFLSRMLLFDRENFIRNSDIFLRNYFSCNRKTISVNEIMIMTACDLLNYTSRNLMLERKGEIFVEKSKLSPILNDFLPEILFR